jgi:hypothetical protein
MPAAMRSLTLPSRGQSDGAAHGNTSYKRRDTIPPIRISGTNEVVTTPQEESWHAPRAARPVARQMFSSQDSPLDTIRAAAKAPTSTPKDRADSSTARRARPCDWTKVFSPGEMVLLAAMTEQKHLKNTDRNKLDKIFEGTIGTMLELLTDLERSAILTDLESVPRTYSSLVRAAIKLQIIIPSRFLILGQEDQTDNLMRACREYISFLRKRAEDAQAKTIIIKIEDDVIEISSEEEARKPKSKTKRRKAKRAASTAEVSTIKKAKKRKHEVTDEESVVASDEQIIKQAASEEQSPNHLRGDKPLSDHELLQQHLQETEQENGHLRSLLEAHGVARTGITMGLLRIKHGYSADRAISGL